MTAAKRPTGRLHHGPLAEKRRILQLEALYDLALALTARRPEQELVDELLQLVCSVLDPAAAVAVTLDAYGGSRAAASVGWTSPPAGTAMLTDALWHKLLNAGEPLSQHGGEFLSRRFRHLLAVPLAYRETYLGYLAVLDKEVRGDEEPDFSGDDRRFLESVAVLSGIALDNARELEQLATQRERLAEENKALRERVGVEVTGGQRIVAQSPAMRHILGLVERIAPRSVNVLVRGESGTGKELIAKLLHFSSGRNGPLIAVNCAAIPETLLESELFGIEGGVATGVQARAGKFELADGGTLFLDEIGDMQTPIQAKLLRALQEREVVRVGGHRSIPFDVRLVAATHREITALVQQREFREDLYYRLKGVEIELPPLRDRRQDIPHLVRHFAEQFCRREGIPVPHFSTEATALLLAHDYPGNIRELQNIVEGAVSLTDHDVDRALIESLLGSGAQERGEALELSEVEHRHITRVLRMTDGNKSAAARILGIDRRTLLRKGF